MELFRSFDEYLKENMQNKPKGKKTNEGKLQIKRKYGTHKSKHVMEKAPVRDIVLGYIGSKKGVKESELKKFFKYVKEARGGKGVSRTWMNTYEKYFKSSMNENDEEVIDLSAMGYKVFNALNLAQRFESEFNDFDDDWVEDATPVYSEDDDMEHDDIAPDPDDYFYDDDGNNLERYPHTDWIK